MVGEVIRQDFGARSDPGDVNICDYLRYPRFMIRGHPGASHFLLREAAGGV